MHIALDPEQLALRAELQEYFDQLVTPERKAGLASATGEFGDAGSTRRSSARSAPTAGSGIGWPKEYGGQARSMVEQLIFSDAAAVAGVPIPYLTLNTVGPTIMRFGTDEQKEYFLPKILAGELHFSIGYSEPGSGTDLASLKTKAVREGDEWVINGQKMWTSLIQYADWIWLACRTDPDLPRHKGLSMILVPADAAGFSYTPVHTVAGVGTSATYYEDVRVPASNLVGELNGGWPLMTNQLNHERVSLTSAAPTIHSLKLVREWAQQTKAPDGQRVIDTEWVQIALGRAHARVEALTPAQLEARGRRRRRRDALPRRGVGDQDLRLRAQHRGLPHADGGRRAQRGRHGRLRRSGARGSARALPPLLAGDDLRRRHQRDPARHHRLRRTRPARPRSR